MIPGKPGASRTRRWLMPGLLSAILAGGALWYGQPAPPAPAVEPPPRQAAGPTGGTASQAGGGDSTRPAPLPVPGAPEGYRTPASLGPDPFAPSLAGTDIDGALRADTNGRLVIDLRVRDFFDYFLSTVGEVSPETAIGQIRRMARRHLPAPAADRAMALLDQYLAYKQAALSVMQTELDPALRDDQAYQLRALGDALASLKQLRQVTFDPEVHQAFFGQEEAYSEYTLATLAIQQRDDLSARGKQALIDWHRNQLPESMRRTEQHLQASTQQQQARVAAITSAASPEAAGDQLAELGLAQEDIAGVVSYLEDREHFADRFRDFREILNHEGVEGLPAADRDARREDLLQQYFPDDQSRTWARLKLLGNS